MPQRGDHPLQTLTGLLGDRHVPALAQPRFEDRSQLRARLRWRRCPSRRWLCRMRRAPRPLQSPGALGSRLLLDALVAALRGGPARHGLAHLRAGHRVHRRAVPGRDHGARQAAGAPPGAAPGALGPDRRGPAPSGSMRTSGACPAPPSRRDTSVTPSSGGTALRASSMTGASRWTPTRSRISAVRFRSREKTLSSPAMTTAPGTGRVALRCSGPASSTASIRRHT